MNQEERKKIGTEANLTERLDSFESRRKKKIGTEANLTERLDSFEFRRKNQIWLSGPAAKLMKVWASMSLCMRVDVIN